MPIMNMNTQKVQENRMIINAGDKRITDGEYSNLLVELQINFSVVFIQWSSLLL